MQILHLLLSLLFAKLAATASFLLLYSQNTPEELRSKLAPEATVSWLSAGIHLSTVEFASGAEVAIKLRSVTAVIDASYSVVQSNLIAGLCDELEIVHLVIGYVTNPHQNKWTFYVNGRQREVMTALNAVTKFYDWSRLNVVTDLNSQLGQVGELLKGLVGRTYRSIEILQEESAGKAVGKIMRMSGNRVNVFVTLPELTKKIVAEQARKHIGGEGFGNVMPLLSSLHATSSSDIGTLILAEEELSQATSQQEYFRQILSQVSELCDSEESSACLAALNSQYPSHYREKPFTLLNVQQGGRVAVGRVTSTGEVELTGKVYFLGNTTEVPKNAKVPLQISGNFGVGNVNGIITTTLMNYRGATFAIDQVNSRTDVLDNFHIELLNFTAGVTEWSYAYAYANIYPHKEKLGLAVLTGLTSVVTMGLIKLLGDIGYQGPIVGSSNILNELSSRAAFPSYIRTILPELSSSRAYMQMFKQFNWKHCGLFVSNESWGLAFQRGFTQYANENNITLANSHEHQILPSPIHSIEMLYQYKESFLNFTNSKARILIITANTDAILVVDYLYELGMRTGDVQIVANGWLTYSDLYTSDKDLLKKRGELLQGAIQLAPASFVGELGKKVYSEFKEKYGAQPAPLTCLYYDSALAVAYALDLVTFSGLDYMNTTVLLKYLRGSRFKGCSGTVTFDSNTNDRSPTPNDILNVQFSPNESAPFNITTVGEFDPMSTVLVKFFEDIVWCDGTSVVPKDTRESSVGCPFEDRLSHDFPRGRYVLYAVTGFVWVEALLCAVVMSRLVWRNPVGQLTTRREIQVSDVLAEAQIWIEMIQYVLLYPTFDIMAQRFLQFMFIGALDLSRSITLKDGGFEKVWIEVFAMSLLWGALFIIVFFRLDERFKEVPGCLTFGNIAEVLAPIIANFFFVPIISVLLDAFVCTEGLSLHPTDITFGDTYMRRDCYLSCWTGAHTWLVAGSSFTLLLFIPLSTFAKPLFQELQTLLNIKASPAWIFLKATAQVTLISLSKVEMDVLVHCCAFILVFICLTLFSLKYSCFNYSRMNLWNSLSLLAVLWFALLSLAHQLSEKQTYPFAAALLSGWLFLLAFGATYQRLRIPSMLYRKPGVNTILLFRFGFSRPTQALVSEIKDEFRKAGNRSMVSISESISHDDRTL